MQSVSDLHWKISGAAPRSPCNRTGRRVGILIQWFGSGEFARFV